MKRRAMSEREANAWDLVVWTVAMAVLLSGYSQLSAHAASQDGATREARAMEMIYRQEIRSARERSSTLTTVMGTLSCASSTETTTDCALKISEDQTGRVFEVTGIRGMQRENSTGGVRVRVIGRQAGNSIEAQKIETL